MDPTAAKRRAGILWRVIVYTGLALVLGAILFPVHYGSGRSPKSGCLSNVKQLGTGTAIYMADHDESFPIASMAVESGVGRPTAVGWGARIYPYVKNAGIYRCPLDGDGGEKAPGDTGRASERNEDDRLSYAMNANVAATPRASEATAPSTSVLLYEVAGTPPARAIRVYESSSSAPSPQFAGTLLRSPVGDGAAGGLLDSTDPNVPPTARPATGPLANAGLPEDTPTRHERGSSFCFLDTSVRFLRPGELSAGANATSPADPESRTGGVRPDLPGVDRPRAEGAGRKGRKATFSLR